MPTIDFYRIYETTDRKTFLAICHFLEKLYQKKDRIYVHVADESFAHQLDGLLWTFRDISFIPHQLFPAPKNTPIVIGYKHHDAYIPYERLLNLDLTIPPFFSRFKNVIEIISENEQQKENARKKYRQYQKKGYTIVLHNFIDDSK